MTQKKNCKSCKHICTQCRYFVITNPYSNYGCSTTHKCHAVQKTELNCVTGDEEIIYGNPEELNKTGCCTKYKKLVSLIIIPLLEALKKEMHTPCYTSENRTSITEELIQLLIDDIAGPEKTAMDVVKAVLAAASSYYCSQHSYCDGESGFWSKIRNALKALEDKE